MPRQKWRCIFINKDPCLLEKLPDLFLFFFVGRKGKANVKYSFLHPHQSCSIYLYHNAKRQLTYFLVKAFSSTTWDFRYLSTYITIIHALQNEIYIYNPEFTAQNLSIFAIRQLRFSCLSDMISPYCLFIAHM